MGVRARINDVFFRKRVSSVTFLLVGLFGIGSWIAINGLWVELPILVSKVPEGWALPSYLTIIIQVANIGPFLYTVGNRYFPKHVHEIPAVYAIVGIGTAASALLGFFWDETSVVTGRLHSTALLVLSFFLAAVDCTSSVVFLPYMALFRKEYMSALFVGEGMSGLLPSLVALGQGIGGGGGGFCSNANFTNSSTVNTTQPPTLEEDAGPNFTANVFFFFLCGMMVLCGLAFVCLNHLPTCKKEHVDHGQEKYQHQRLHKTEREEFDLELQETKPFSVPVVGDLPLHPKARIVYLLVIQAWINALANGVIPSLQSYACLPYSYQAYHLTLTLSNIINPVSCLVFHMIPMSSVLLISLGAVLYTGVCAYIVTFASMSPAPPLVGTESGEVLMVFMCVLSVATVTYTKVAIAAVMREEGQKQLLWCGISMQVGSCIGALTIFPLVNIYSFFKQPQTSSC